MYIIGNGESRKNINLNNLGGIKIACNAVCRDYFVDHLVCVDRRMVDEAHTFYNYNFNVIYTRSDWLESRSHIEKLKCVPDIPYKPKIRQDEPFQWGSGPYAVLLGATLGSKTIRMIGFDLYGNNQKVNNIYKDTKHYDSSTKSAVDPSYWVYQIAKVFECFPNTKFILHNNPKWHLPDLWNYPNVSLDNLSNL